MAIVMSHWDPGCRECPHCKTRTCFEHYDVRVKSIDNPTFFVACPLCDRPLWLVGSEAPPIYYQMQAIDRETEVKPSFWARLRNLFKSYRHSTPEHRFWS